MDVSMLDYQVRACDGVEYLTQTMAENMNLAMLAALFVRISNFSQHNGNLAQAANQILLSQNAGELTNQQVHQIMLGPLGEMLREIAHTSSLLGITMSDLARADIHAKQAAQAKKN